MSLLEVNKITPQSGTTLTLGDSGDTINFGSGVLPNFENLTVTGDLTVDTNSLKVDSTNNRVGIGTANPSYNLDLSSSSDAIINLKAAGQANGLQLSQLTADGGSSISATNNNYLKFSTNATEAMRIDSSGNVLVGKTTTDFGTAGILVSGSGSYNGTRTGKPMSLNRLGSDGEILEFYKDSSSVGSISANAGNMEIDTTKGAISHSANDIVIYSKDAGHNGLRMHANGILPTDNTGAIIDNDANLGESSYRFKDFYLGGNIYLGGTGIANALDDYEEGTWTATFSGSSDTSTGYYRKIGTIVFVQVYSGAINVTSSVNAEVGGLPFNAIDYAVGAITHNTYATGSENGYFNTSNNKFIILNENSVGVTQSVVGNPKYIMMSGCYITN